MAEKKAINKTFMHLCISFVIMLAGSFLPAPAPVTRMGMQVIFVFIGMIYGWCVSTMMWPSLLGILMLGLTEYMASSTASFTAFITNSSVLGMVTSFVVLGFLASSGLLVTIAKWIVTRKSLVGKPWKFIVVISLVVWFASAVFHTVVTMILFFSLILGLLKDMGYTKEDMLPTFMLMDIAIIAAFGAMWLPFMPNALFVQGLIFTSVGANLTTLQYLGCISLPSFLAVVVYLLVGRFLLRIDTTKFIKASESAADEIIEVTATQKHAIVALIIFVLGVGLPAVCPATWPPIAVLNRMGIVGVSIAVTIGLIVLNGKDGKPIATFKEMASEGYGDFSAIVLSGSILLVGASVTAKGTGIVEAISAFLLPLINQMSIALFIAVIAIFLALISQVSMNMVLMMIFSPLLAAVLSSVGANPIMSIMVAYLAPNVAFLAPSGSMPAALVFSRTDWVEKKNLYKIVVPWVILAVMMFIILTLTLPNIFCPEFVR